MKVIISLSLCFNLCSSVELKSNDLESLRFARQTGQDSSSIRQIANDFSILARLVNGISLQEGLSDGSANPDVVIAELLNIESSNTVRDLIQMKLDTNDISSKLEKMLNDVGKLGANPLTNSTQVKDAINALKNMAGDVEDLKKEDKNGVKEFKEKGEKMKLVYEPQMKWDQFEKVVRHLQTIKNGEPSENDVKTIVAFNEAASSIRATDSTFTTTIEQFKNYKTTTSLQKLWGIKGNYTVLTPISKISKAAQALDQNWEVYSTLSEKLKLLQKDAKTLNSLIQQNQFHSSLSISLTPIAALVKDLHTLRNSDRVWTEGFPNGPSDISKIKDDLKGSWLKEKIVEGNDIAKLSSSFQLIEKFNEQLTTINEEWISFKKHDGSANLLSKFSAIFKVLADNGEALSKISGLDDTVNTLTGAVTNLKKIQGSPNFAKFDELYSYSSKISEYADQFEKEFKKMENMAFEKAEDAITELKTLSEKLKGGFTILQTIELANKMKQVEGLDKLVEITAFAYSNLKPLLSGEFTTFVNKVPDWKSIYPVQKSLEGTELIEALNKLGNQPLEFESIDKMLHYGTKIRQIEIGSIRSLKEVLNVIEKLRFGVTSAKSSIENKSKRRRDSGINIKKLKESKSIAFDLGRGVSLLRRLADVYKEGGILMTVSEYPATVNTAIKSLPGLQSVWTDENRNSLKEMSTKLDQLEKYAQENKDKKDLIEEGSIFGKASEIRGAPIDNKLLKSTVVPALEKHSISTVTATAPTFLKLSELELDFSKHSTRIKAAALTLPSLRDYFDEVFGIKRTQTAGQSDAMKDEGQREVSITSIMTIFGASFLVLLLICGGIFLIIRCRKQRQYNNRLRDPETWVLLSFTAENTPNTFGNGFSIEAHKHIIKNNFDSFKKCLKNGAYVDAKLQTDKQSNTMLHEAVLKDKAKYVEALVKHGATREILNHEFETPMQLAVRLKKKKCIQIFKKYEHKKFKIVLPEVFTKNNYLIDVDRAIPLEEHYHGDFFKKFGQYRHEHPKRPTHYVAKTDKDNVLHVKDHHLPMIFSATMIMGHRWLKACLDNPSAIGNNKEWRVTKMSFRGKEYDTLLHIKDYINRMNVPFMFGIGVSYNNHTLAQEWALMRTVTSQLGVYNGSGEFPFMCPKPGHCYHRDDLPRNFFLYHRNDKAQVQLNFKSVWMDNPAYLFLNTDDFTHFLLSFEIKSKKIAKNDETNGIVKPTDKKNKGKDKLVSDESCSATDCSESGASKVSVGTPVSKTGTPNSRTPNSVTPTSRTPGKTTRH